MAARRWSCVALCALALGAGAALAADEFPLDSEMILDVDPMPGSKRIPNMDVMPDGALVLEMWCNRVEGRFVVAADTVTVLTGEPSQRECPPERLAGDEQILAALAQVTHWRRKDDTFELIGPRPLRFKLATN